MSTIQPVLKIGRLPPALRFETQRLSWDVMGGPSQADVEAYGSMSHLYNLGRLLGKEIWFCDSLSGYPWWGYIHSITIHAGLDIAFSLDDLYNKISVAFTYSGEGTEWSGERRTTAYVSDAASIAAFKIKELLHSSGDLTDALALDLANKLLALYKTPKGIPAGGRKGLELSATIHCRGWWETMTWRYAEVPIVVGLSYTNATGMVDQALATNANNKKVYQSFAGSALHIMKLSVVLRKVGAPTGTVSITLHELDGSGKPLEDSLISESIDCAVLTTTLTWYGFDTTKTVLQAGKTYAIQVSRSSAPDASNYVAVGVNPALGFAGGVFRMLNSTTDTWVARAPDADMLFQLEVDQQVETSAQITNLLSSYNQFMSFAPVPASGVVKGSYQDGDKRASAVLTDLLEAGVSGGRRYLVNVTRSKYTLVYEEPAQPTFAEYALDAAGKLYKGNRLVTEPKSPVGKWARVMDLPAGGGSVKRFTALDHQFIESATWTPGQGIQVQVRGAPTAENIMRIRP